MDIHYVLGHLDEMDENFHYRVFNDTRSNKLTGAPEGQFRCCELPAKLTLQRKLLLTAIILFIAFPITGAVIQGWEL